MKELKKDEIKAKLIELNQKAKELTLLYDELEKDYFGEDVNEIEDDVLDERVNKFYNFIGNDFELNELFKEFNLGMQQF